jgi:hypothetical protein
MHGDFSVKEKKWNLWNCFFRMIQLMNLMKYERLWALIVEIM